MISDTSCFVRIRSEICIHLTLPISFDGFHTMFVGLFVCTHLRYKHIYKIAMFYLKFTISSVLVTARAGWNCSIVASGKCSMGAPKIVRMYVTCKCVFLSGGKQGMT